MNVWLTPDRKPFYGGTYFPPRDGDRGVQAGFLTLLNTLFDAYRNEPENITKNAEIFVNAISQQLAPAAGTALPESAVLHAAAAYAAKTFDSQNGGARGAPKFPSGLPVRFLLRYQRRGSDKQSLDMAERTLEKMAQGGIYDHAGGGFHRYATDTRWLVPHFEKMLYDNALLAVAYLEGYQATGREDFARLAREILRYVERDMTSPEGAFYSATDADSPNPVRRARGRLVLYLDSRRDRRGLGSATGAPGQGLLRGNRGRELRGPQHPQRHQAPGTSSGRA
jgi:uncharacterized protein YyaL (SSP411 family)